MYALAEDSVIGRSLREYGEWAEHEIDQLSKFIVDGACIIDVGANIGTHTLAFSRRFPSSTILAVEPQPLPCAMLMANIVENHLQNVRVMNLGAGAQTEVLGVRFDYEALEGNIGAFDVERFKVESAGAYPLLIAPLDRVAAGYDVQFIKIDVEGMEGKVLRGASNLLTSHRPVIFFEVLSAESLLDPADFLIKSGYELYWLETWPFNVNNFRRNTTNVWSICELGILAVPSEQQRVVDLPRASGREATIPRRLDPYGGYNKAERPVRREATLWSE